MSYKTIIIDGVEYKLYGWYEDTISNKAQPHIAEVETGRIPIGQQRRLLKEWLLSNGANIEPWCEKTTHWCVLEAIKLNSSVAVSLASWPERGISNSPIAASATSAPEKSSSHSVHMALTAENIEKQSCLVNENSKYGKESEIIRSALSLYPKNDELNIVAMKIALIDITNSTQLSKFKNKISLFDLTQVIMSIENIDDRIAHGDPEVVNMIAKNTGAINLFSFASKYCTYHNVEIYGRDDYSIYDGIVKRNLPYYAHDISERTIENWRTSFDYASFNNSIRDTLDQYGITMPFRRRKFDHFLWYPNRQNE